MSFARDEPIFDGAADFDLELLESRTLDSAGGCYLGPKHIGAAGRSAYEQERTPIAAWRMRWSDVSGTLSLWSGVVAC
jgi:hypothetical protein